MWAAWAACLCVAGWSTATAAQLRAARGFLQRAGERRGHSPSCSICSEPTVVGQLPPEVGEPSGLCRSRRHAGAYYVINDSPRAARLFLLWETGQVLGTYNLTGIDVPPNLTFGQHGTGDLEALFVAPCEPNGTQETCIFVGDVGHNCIRREFDNKGVKCIWFRPQGLYSLMRFREPPSPGAAALGGERFWFRFPHGDGPYDVETAMASRDGSIFVVTKVETGPAGVYRLPPGFSADPASPAVLERVAEVNGIDGPVGVPGFHPEIRPSWLFTDGGIEQRAGEDARVALLTYGAVLLFPMAGLLAGGGAAPPAAAKSLAAGERLARALEEDPCVQPLPTGLKAEAFCWGPEAASYLVMGEGSRDILKAEC